MAEEFWDVLTTNRVPTGRRLRRGEPMPAGAGHIVVMGWIVRADKQFLISRRSKEKNNPLMWETTGGAKQAGEDSLKAIIREIGEELGVDVSHCRPIFLGSRERRKGLYFDCWMFFKDAPIEAVTLQPGETCDAKWVDDETFSQMIESGQVTAASSEFFPLMKGWRDLLMEKESYGALNGEGKGGIQDDDDAGRR